MHADEVQDAKLPEHDLGWEALGLDWIRRRFHLSESELRDYCADIMDDGTDEDWPGSVSGY